MANTPKIAFLYPGQGAVPEKPLGDRYGQEVRQRYEALRAGACPAYDDFHQGAVHSDLAAQLGVFCLSHSLAEVLQEHGVRPHLTSGYSSGLYGAMAGSRCLTAAQGLAAINHAFDQISRTTTAHAHRMLAIIGLPVDRVEEELARLAAPGWLSLVNNKSQTIVSIPRDEVTAFSAACLTAGALRVMELPFEYPYHGRPLAQAGQELRRFFETLPLSPPMVPLMAGSRPVCINGSAAEAGRQVADQLWQTVHWHHTVSALVGQGVSIMVVLDPTDALTRIIRWQDRALHTRGISSLAHIRELAAALP